MNVVKLSSVLLTEWAPLNLYHISIFVLIYFHILVSMTGVGSNCERFFVVAYFLQSMF